MKRLSRFAWPALLIGGFGLSWAYFRFWMPVERNGMDKDLFNRRIGTPILEWMNGYLGPFFNLDYLGALNWLAIPVIFWWAVRPPASGAWQRGLALLAAGGALVIGAFGGFNPRYAFTLYPLLLAMVFAGTWAISEKWGASLRLRRQLLASLVVLQFLNTALNVDYRIRAWHVEKADRAANPQGAPIEAAPTATMGIDGWLGALGLKETDRVLVNNLPQYWYGSQRFGLYYWSGSDQLFEANGPGLLFGTHTDDQVAQQLTTDLDCRYILTTADLSEYGDRFLPFLRSHCVLMGVGPERLQLYRIRQTPVLR